MEWLANYVFEKKRDALTKYPLLVYMLQNEYLLAKASIIPWNALNHHIQCVCDNENKHNMLQYINANFISIIRLVHECIRNNEVTKWCIRNGIFDVVLELIHEFFPRPSGQGLDLKHVVLAAWDLHYSTILLTHPLPST